MGSVDLPPFLRDKQKENIQKQKSGELPPFIKKKEGEDVLETSVPVSTSGSQTGSSRFGTRDANTPSLSLTAVTPEVTGNPYAPILDVVSKARPETKAQTYQQLVGLFESGDPDKIKIAQKQVGVMRAETNPSTLTKADRQEIQRLTGTDDPAKQLQVIKARIGTLSEGGNITFNLLDPTLGIDVADLPAAPSDKLGLYADKLDYLLNKKPDSKWSSQKVTTIGGKETTQLESFLNMINPNPIESLVSEGMRYGSETLNDSFSTGLESIRTTDKAKYDRIVRQITEGKAIPTTDIVSLTAAGAKIRNDHADQDLIDDKITEEDYATQKNSVAGDYQNNIYKHPDYLRSIISDVIAKNYESDAFIFNQWMISDKEIDAVPKNKYIEAGLDPDNPEFKKQLSFIKDKEGWMPFQNAIAKDDLFREFRKGFMSVPEGVVSTVESVVKPNEVLVADRLATGFNVSEVANQRGKYFQDNYGAWADAFNGFGQFTAQIGAMLAGNELVAVAGESLGGGTVAARLLGASKVEKLGNLLVDNASTYAQFGTPFVITYGDYYKDALSKGANPLQAKMMAFTNASVEGVSETFFDNIEFGKQVARDIFKKQNFDKIAKVFDRGVLDEVAEQEYKQTLSEIITNTAKTTGKAALGAFKESFEEVPVALTNFVVDAAANPANVDGRDVVTEMKDAFLSGLVSFSIPSLIGLGGSLYNQSKEQKPAQESLMIAAMQAPYVSDAINRQLEKGDISQQDANRKLKILNTAAQQLNELPETYEDGQPLSPLDREKYLSLSVKEKLLEGITKNGDKGQQAIAEKQVDEAVRQKETILSKSSVREGDNFTVTVDDKTAVVEPAATPSLFERVQSVLATPKSETQDEINRAENVKTLSEKDVLPAMVAQSIDVPIGVMNELRGDRELTTDVIAQNSVEDIEAARKKWVRTDSETADDNISLLEEGLAKKQTQNENTIKSQTDAGDQQANVQTNEALQSDEGVGEIISKSEAQPAQRPVSSGVAVVAPSQSQNVSTRRGVTVVAPQEKETTVAVGPQVAEGPVTEAPATEPQQLFTTRVRNLAATIRERGLREAMPDWAKADLPEGTQKQGFGGKALDEVVARSLELVADVMEAGGQLADAISTGFNNLRDYYSNNTKSFDENKLRREFTKNVNTIFGLHDTGKPRVRVVAPGFTADEDGNRIALDGNFFENKALSVKGERAEFLSKPTIEAGTQQEITQVFDYDKIELDLMLADGQRWIEEAKLSFTDSPVHYATRLLADVRSFKGSTAVKAVAMANLLNSIDNDLRNKNFSAGERDIMIDTRTKLENTIAQNAREGSLTLNAQRLIYKLYHGEYKMSDELAKMVTKDVQDKADKVTNGLKAPKSDISDKARQQHAKNKDKAPPAASKRKPGKVQASKGKYESAAKKLIAENVKKLKQEIIDLAKKIKC